MDQPKHSETDEHGSGHPPGLRLEERIYQELLARIQSGAYAIGQRLPPELELSSEFGVSRPVIRAALAKLRDAGLITSRRGAGSFVASGDSGRDAGFSSLGSIEDIDAFFAYREIIEVESAVRAAARATPETVAELRAILEEMDRDIEAGVATVELDLRFHARIAELSGNRFLLESLHMLRPHTFFMGRFVRSLSATGYVRGKMGMRGEHHAIVDALEHNDPAAARAAMKAHLTASRERIFKGE